MNLSLGHTCDRTCRCLTLHTTQATHQQVCCQLDHILCCSVQDWVESNRSPSVSKHFSFHGFLQPWNPDTYSKKLETETWQPMSLFVETCLRCLTGSSQALQHHTILLMNFLSRFSETWKLAKTSGNPEVFLPNCWCHHAKLVWNLFFSCFSGIQRGGCSQ